MSLEDLAGACGMEPEHFRLIEEQSGIARPPPQIRECMAKVLGVPEDELFPAE